MYTAMYVCSYHVHFIYQMRDQMSARQGHSKSITAYVVGYVIDHDPYIMINQSHSQH